MKKIPAALSFDLDNLWSYLKTRGDASWRAFPTYLPVLIPQVLEFMRRRGLRPTFFVVGQDAALEENAESLSCLAEEGFEIGNHSFHHEPWFHREPPGRIQEEIAAAEEAIAAATGKRPEGFRGPGFAWSPDLLGVLSRRGYRYDASLLPTFLGPLGRLYYFSKSALTTGERKQRRQLFGTLGQGFYPLKPFRWLLPAGGGILEIPVTTMPFFRTPFHLSYLLYLGGFAESLMTGYLRTALAACRKTGVRPSFLLHPLDFLGPEDAPGLAFFPGMDIKKSDKLRLAGRALDILAEDWELLPLGKFAVWAETAGRLRHVRAGSRGKN